MVCFINFSFVRLVTKVYPINKLVPAGIDTFLVISSGFPSTQVFSPSVSSISVAHPELKFPLLCE